MRIFRQIMMNSSVSRIFYTSTNGLIVSPYSSSAFDAKIVSNNYKDKGGTIVFDKQLKHIGDKAFYNRVSLVSITIPDSVTSIGASAFEYCSSLTSITIPDGVTEIGSYAFRNCSSLTNFYGKFASEDSRCLIVDGVLASFAPSGLTEYTIPDNVTSIGGYAFSNYTSLASVIIGNGVTSIGSYAFYNCDALTSITIPDSVTTIKDFAFYACSKLTSVTIGNGVTTVGYCAFRECSELTSVTIGNSVTSIGTDAFVGCTGLTSIIVSSGNAKYDSRENCNCLIETTTNELIRGCNNSVIPDSVTSIGANAFMYCISLTSITIPNSVTSIGIYAFRDCSSMSFFDFSSHTFVPTLSAGETFSGNTYFKIIIPDALYNQWIAATNWATYASRIIKKSDWDAQNA